MAARRFVRRVRAARRARPRASGRLGSSLSHDAWPVCDQAASLLRSAQRTRTEAPGACTRRDPGRLRARTFCARPAAPVCRPRTHAPRQAGARLSRRARVRPSFFRRRAVAQSPAPEAGRIGERTPRARPARGSRTPALLCRGVAVRAPPRPRQSGYAACSHAAHELAPPLSDRALRRNARTTRYRNGDPECARPDAHLAPGGREVCSRVRTGKHSRTHCHGEPPLTPPASRKSALPSSAPHRRPCCA